VNRNGGVVVRRYGNHNSNRFQFGYTYRIEMNQPSTSVFSNGSVSLQLDCYGLACGCAEALVPLLDMSGLPNCPNHHNFSIVNSSTCNVPPTITVSRISTLAYTRIIGAGVIEFRGGSHRLPPRTNSTISIAGSATGILAANTAIWEGLQAKDYGQLIITGLGWKGWDNAVLLYAPHWTDERGLSDVFDNVPTCTLRVNSYFLSGLGSVLVASPDSQLIWQRGAWNGGIIGGLAYLNIVQMLMMDGSGRSLKYGMTLTLTPTARGFWKSGNISLANGAQMIVQGVLTIDNANQTSTLQYPMTMGEARFLQSITDPPVLLQEEGGRNWQSYFSLSIPAELRPGWYINPLCDDRCQNTNLLIISQNGSLVASNASDANFLLPVQMIGYSRMNVGVQGSITFSSGGICGNKVIVDLKEGTTFTLKGGQMQMDSTCTIQGAGELLVVEGEHSVGFSIDAHITIAGGTLLWPDSRDKGQTITFNGGLLIKGTGVLEVQPYSTSIIVNKGVVLKDQSLIQFPLIGIAAQASTFDSADAPDTSPRGKLDSNGDMYWYGGTLKGKADFNALKALFLDGDMKYIQSLAKIVNHGHCEWGSGDLIASDNGDFQNFGTVQMMNGVHDFSGNAFYKGTALPVENGGDVFALEFHSWDTDLGALNTEEYVRLTSLLVSKVPVGWKPEDQG
jgi:hypothetical protein